MTNIRKYWSVVALVFSFAAGYAIHQLAPAAVQAAGKAPPSEVIVTNTPLPVQGSVGVTGTVGINNFPVTQSVSGTVGISGNSAATPLLVRDVDNDTRQPVAFGLNDSVQAFTVPSNKRLVVEYVSWRGTVNKGNIVAAGLDVFTNGVEATYYIPGSPVSGENIGGANVRLVADPGTQVVLQSAGAISDTVHFSGYYVDVP